MNYRQDGKFPESNSEDVKSEAQKKGEPNKNEKISGDAITYPWRKKSKTLICLKEKYLKQKKS